MQNDPPSGISASPVSEDNLFLWNATIIGPDDSPWEGAAREADPPSWTLPARPHWGRKRQMPVLFPWLDSG
jgi:hypothetical protein